MSDALLIERDGRVLILTMHRPEVKNALNPEMLCRLADAWDVANADDEVRCVILTGAGGDFCAGADLDKLVARSIANLPPEDEFEARCRENPDTIFRGLLRSVRLAKPLIAAIEGYCVAGGTEILQATDIRVAGEGAVFGITEVKWGLFPQGGSTVRLRRQIPYTMAMELLLTGDTFPAADALRFGLIGRIVAKGGALAAAREIAARVSANGPVAVRKVKQSVQETEALPEREALDLEFKIGMEVYATEDAREGPRAFKEKRAPQFKGR
ncbi:MAG TPA: crotonase/enoyl-CoA hydratase family protein [Dehalococcoidia bacterium]|nr:crotonase/enoyl-CoA hydratase family protein [Dehalococcoidia bacterium]